MAYEDWLVPEESLNNTVSIRRGMSRDTEDQHRREGVKIIVRVGAGDGMKLKQNPTLGSAAVFFHRFYMRHTFQEYPKEITALTCIFLAGKVEETPKKCRDITHAAEIRFPEIYLHRRNLVEDVMGVERVLLQVLKFDLQVEHPYKYLIEYMKTHELSKEIANGYVQRAWTFTNDSYYTPICLLWEPQIIAVGMLHLSFNVGDAENNFKPREEWWDKFISDLSPTMLEKVCHLVLDFYTVTRNEAAQQQQAGNGRPAPIPAPVPASVPAAQPRPSQPYSNGSAGHPPANGGPPPRR